MKKWIYLSSLSVITAISLAGCGGGGSAADTVATATENTGYFVDSAVAGLDYNTSSNIKGVTGNLGQFKYKDGDRVTFRIGKFELGTVDSTDVEIVNGKPVVTPQDLAQDNNETAVKIAQILMSLDSDENATNGITIPEDVRVAFEKDLNKTISIKHLEDKEEFKNGEVEGLPSDITDCLDKNYDGKIDIDENDAIEHLKETEHKLKDGTLNIFHDKEDKGNKDKDKEKNHGENNNSGTLNAGMFDINSYPESNLTQELKDAIAYMGNEERLAHDVYTTLYNYHLNNGDDIKQLTNIATRSETKHISIVQSIVKKYNITSDDLTNVSTPVGTPDKMPVGEYDIEKIQKLYDDLVAMGEESKEAALKVGCIVEVTDVDDLNEYIALAQESNATDIEDAFKILRSGSYKHYWAFDKGLKRIGVENGCCSLGEKYCKSEDEYPKAEKIESHQSEMKGKNGKNHQKDMSEEEKEAHKSQMKDEDKDSHQEKMDK